MEVAMKIEGLSRNEQLILGALKSGEPKTIYDLAKLFIGQAINYYEERGLEYTERDIMQRSQYIVRMVLRSKTRIVRDGWIRRYSAPTNGSPTKREKVRNFALTSNGKRWIAEGKNKTKSADIKRGRKPNKGLAQAVRRKMRLKEKEIKQYTLEKAKAAKKDILARKDTEPQNW